MSDDTPKNVNKIINFAFLSVNPVAETDNYIAILTRTELAERIKVKYPNIMEGNTSEYIESLLVFTEYPVEANSVIKKGVIISVDGLVVGVAEDTVGVV